MARVMICDNDSATVNQLVAALRAVRHNVTTCHHTIDVLRGAVDGRIDLLAFGLDMHGFDGTSAIEVMQKLAPDTLLIGLHKRPSEVMRTAVHSSLAAVLPRPVAVDTFIYAVARALETRELRAPTPVRLNLRS
jgi:DNA-binding NtrC family response regulator